MLAVIIFPFVIALYTYDFFKTREVMYIQPDVKFTNEMIVEALINDGTVDKVYQFSTVQNINNRFSNLLTAPRLSVNSKDYNSDLLNDDIEIEFKFTTTSAMTVKSVHILFYLQYYIGDDVNAQMKTLVYKEFDASNGNNLRNVRLKGPLKLYQKNPIAPGTMKRELYNSQLEDDYLQYGIMDILDLYQMRNQTTKLNAQPLISSYGSTTETKITMNIEIPTVESVDYYPSALQVLKRAWVQYLGILIPIYFILYVFIYGNIVKRRFMK